MIDEYGLKIGRWLIKTGPCKNLFFKDTKRGGWYKLAKTTAKNTVYGEPQGKMMDVRTTHVDAAVPFRGYCPPEVSYAG